MDKNIKLCLLLLIFAISFVGCSSGKSVPQPTESRDLAPVVKETDINSLSAAQSTESRDRTPDVKETDIDSLSVAKSQKSRIIAPDVGDMDGVSLGVSNRTFAFDLYQALRDENGNLFFSPYSISAALAMMYAGARGETKLQIKKVLSYSLPQERLHPAFNALDQTLANRGQGGERKDGEGFRLNIVNAIWGQEGHEFLSEYLDTLALNYDAGIQLVDFVADPEGSRKSINEWVSEQTEDRIDELIPSGAIHELTRLVLTNAMYFNAGWEFPFPERSTEIGKFYLLAGDPVEVPMMSQVEEFGYGAGEGYQAVELPYSMRELSMVIIVPDLDRFEDFESRMNQEIVDNIINTLEQRKIDLKMPKFEFKQNFDLAKPLAAMGMPSVFSVDADFSGMDGTRDLLIWDVVHQAFVSVDEAGTEAAAATSLGFILLGGSIEEPILMKIDRPFIFLIRDIETDTILFLGRVLDPR
jgi:serpin B